MDVDGAFLNQVAHAVADLALARADSVKERGAYKDAVIKETRLTKADHVRALVARAEQEGVTLSVDDVASAVYRGITLDELQRDKQARQRLAALDAEIGRNRERETEDPAPAAPGGRLRQSTKDTGKRHIEQIRERLRKPQ